ncbi:ABC transporter substrate-binding protein [Merdimonas faecis]|uniref:ABC transporter substrate-binding protein n=1 Tax=Merdimonas faecis TaxID=1653435 RepID=A0A9D2VVQ2_9FIRM|nr:ABC transporter substrate-binding protein [Merdimonas faecis]HJH48719.1 ABC transporter substrate-binding protein [Merdimonas faecis]
MKKRVLAALLVTAMTTAMLMGCGGSSDSQETGNDAEETTEGQGDGELQKITVCEPVRGILWAPVYVALEEGYFEEEGLDVEITTVQSDMPTAPVLADEAQFGLYGPEMICKFVAEGQDTQLIYTCTDTYPYSFFLGKNVDSIEDLKGTTVNGADSGSSPRAFVRSIINNAGLDADNDVTYANMDNSAVIAALESGEVSATYASPELRAQLIEAGYDVTVDIYDKEVHKELLGSETYEMYIVFGKKSYIDENPEITQSFVNACYKGAQYLENHEVSEIVDTLQGQFSEMENLEQIVTECKENSLWSADGVFSDSGVEAINNMAISSGLITEPIAKDDLVNETFAQKAAEEAE